MTLVLNICCSGEAVQSDNLLSNCPMHALIHVKVKGSQEISQSGLRYGLVSLLHSTKEETEAERWEYLHKERQYRRPVQSLDQNPVFSLLVRQAFHFIIQKIEPHLIFASTLKLVHYPHTIITILAKHACFQIFSHSLNLFSFSKMNQDVVLKFEGMYFFLKSF